MRAAQRNQALWAANLERTSVAEIDGHWAGYGVWALIDRVPTVVTPHGLPSHRRRGLGAALLDLVVDDGRRNGHPVLALGLHRENPARHLYESADFTPAGEDGDYLLFRRSLVS